ncbi:hypothetical protein ACLOAU_17695 [Niabella sp. CJ426]|uniref:hypothetical protein n=1 Tax=Niabella sp. CJ426 TaxID=3393740 RepID=UPI003CFCF199
MKIPFLIFMFVFTGCFLNAQDFIYSIGQYGNIGKYQIDPLTGGSGTPVFSGDGTTDQSKAIAVNSSGVIYYIPFIPISSSNQQPAENRGKIDVYAIADGSSVPLKVVDQFDVNDVRQGFEDNTKVSPDVFGIDKNGVAWIISTGAQWIYITKFQTYADGSVNSPQRVGSISLPISSGGNGVTDIAFNFNGDMYALLTGDGPFYSYIGIAYKNNLVSTNGTIDIKSKWILFNPVTQRPLTVKGNGLCFTSTGNLLMSADDGIYFIDQTTVNQPSTGFVHASKVYHTANSATIRDLASLYYPSQTALPVMLEEINASVRSGHLNVNWTTLSETNNSHFDIELSRDGETFFKIGSIVSKAIEGNSDKKLNYLFSAPFEKLSEILLLSLSSSFFFNRKKSKLLLGLIFIVIICAIGCKKSHQIHLNDERNWFVRVVQVDLNAKRQYSKIIAIQQ